MDYPICKACAKRAKAEGYLTHELPPYLQERGNIIKCHLCKKHSRHAMNLNAEFSRHPRKVRCCVE